MKDFNLSELRYQILSVLNQKNSHSLTEKEIVEALSNYFELSKEDREEKTSSGQLRFYKTVAGQEQLLKRAGFEDFGKGYAGCHIITEKGKEILSVRKGSIYPEDMKNKDQSETKSIECSKNSSQHYKHIGKNGCTMLTIPLEQFQRNIDRDLLVDYPCLYILSNGKRYYIGFSGNAFERIYVHTKKQRFSWTVAYVFLYTDPKDGSHFNMSDAAYLEYLSLNLASYHKTINLKKADRPYMKPKDEEKMEKMFFVIKELLHQADVQVFK